jgi:DNA-binding response OmpR family regulator
MRGGTVEKNCNAIMPTAGERVLIVDDDSFLLEAFQFIMEDAGFAVETARSGQEALNKAWASPFNLVITDLCLPDINGNELSRLVKEVNPNVSVVILTGASSKGKVEIHREPDDVLSKPANLLELLRISNSYKNL